MNKKHIHDTLVIYLNILVGFVAITIGYPYGGNVFILAMAPYLIYMVFKCDAKYLPALILHCASETSAFSVVFLSFVILSIYKYKALFNLGLKSLFWVLMGLLPVFIWLVMEYIFTHNMYPPAAVAQSGYYLSFFAFFYGVLIIKTLSKSIISAVYVTLFVVYVLYLTNAIEFTRVVVGFTFLFSSSLALFLAMRSKSIILLPLSLFAFLSVITISEESTLTTLFVSVSSFLVAFLYLKGKTTLIQKATGILPFILIIVLYTYGINSYLNADSAFRPEQTRITNLSDLRTWTHWKFFQDRAPYWAGGFYQILDYKHLFPIPEMPDIIATFSNRAEREITFGSHTTFIELIRRYGIIAGALLSLSLVYIVIISRKVLSLPKLNPLLVPLFSMAIVTTIVLSLTGQYQILPGYALLSIGVLGIGYGVNTNANKINQG